MKRIVLMTMTMMATSLMQAQGLQYPKAEKDGTVDDYFGVKVADPYRWLENDTSAQTAAWVEAENKVTNAYLGKIPTRGKLLKRLTELSNYEKIGAPRKRHGKWYFYKNNGLQNQSVLYVMDNLGGTPRVFLDPMIYGKSIMMDARLHPVNEPKKSHQPLLCNILGIIVITEETAANREHQLTERRGNMFKLFLRHLLYKRMST